MVKKIVKKLAIKIDVDTDRGTKQGCPPLAQALIQRDIPATWLWSLGNDNTGRAIIRIFRPGFFQKVSRTSIVQVYGLRTLMNGTILPAPHIGKRNGDLMRSLDIDLFEHGIHCWDHVYWQDFLHGWDLKKTKNQLQLAQNMFVEIFGRPAKTAGTPGWQANANSLQAYDELGFDYGSDTRVGLPFQPKVGEITFRTPQIPTNLPTLDELIGRDEFPIEKLIDHYLSCMVEGLNVLTIHAELEGMMYLEWFTDFLDACTNNGIEFVKLEDEVKTLKNLPVKQMIQAEIDGRSGTLAVPQS